MDWQRHFQNLAQLAEEKKQKDARENERRRREAQEINKKFYPVVKKVCKEFARAVGWHFQKHSSGFQMFPHMNDEWSASRSGKIIEVDINITFLSTSAYRYEGYPSGVLILREGEEKGPRKIYVIEGEEWKKESWEYNSWPIVIIPLGTFTEEKLAEALEIVFKKMEGII